VKFGSVNKELHQLKEKLESLYDSSQGEASKEITRTRQHVDEVLYREEVMLLQRS
jgi:ElaB/YqjD/DUF883 family membrane-anchored ribosome-binding protein